MVILLATACSSLRSSSSLPGGTICILQEQQHEGQTADRNRVSHQLLVPGPQHDQDKRACSDGRQPQETGPAIPHSLSPCDCRCVAPICSGGTSSIVPANSGMFTCTVSEGGLSIFCDARAWVAYSQGRLRWSWRPDKL